MKIQEERVLLLMEENGITQRKMAQAQPMRLVILFPRPRILPFMHSGS